MSDDWTLKDKRKLFRSLREWGCDASCGLYKFNEEKREVTIPDGEEKWTPEKCRKLDDYDIDEIIKKYKWYYLRGDDIETLRQKLIEDLKIQCPEDQIEIEYIINKRFGVKENEEKTK